GSPSMQKFCFKALRPGTMGIIFNYKRPWEKGEPLVKKIYIVVIED
ncbi:MAG: protease inhibitor I42 family protein, partial [Thaumarchaeota archaeon]|nr:protease inhibitor I42 family protein [Nitrososphaerota archaeon]